MFYVNMIDKFMSGWGLAANGRSILTIECQTLEQAETIEKAAHDRDEMKYIDIAQKPRRGRIGDHISRRVFADMGGPWLKYRTHNNQNCDGAGPHDPDEVKLYPTGGGGNAILCRRCWSRENNFNDERGHAIKSWYNAKSYETA